MGAIELALITAIGLIVLAEFSHAMSPGARRARRLRNAKSDLRASVDRLRLEDVR